MQLSRKMGRGQRAEEGTHLVAAGQRQGGKAEEWLQSLEGIVETCQLSCRRQGVLSGCCRLCGVCTPAAVVLLLVRGGAGTDRPLVESVWVWKVLSALFLGSLDVTTLVAVLTGRLARVRECRVYDMLTLFTRIGCL